ncbi:fibronectin type III domain-containing protein, partial [Candidatus Parcubacteria bacterium]|nr:fibronectin type III domain-containing protein [Candidatus Parcubacteria bacterium]
MSKLIGKKINIAILALQIVALVLFIIYPVQATSLDSSNYRVVDYDVDLGGSRSTSTNYTMVGDIGLFITAVSSTPEEEGGGEEPGGGGEEPPPPPPPDTTPPVISGVSAINITQTGATIIWNTDEVADSLVEYGLTPAYGGSVASSTLLLGHSLNLISLLPETLYHFRVKSKDASLNQATSLDYTFTTLAVVDITSPIISNIRVLNITGTSATVLWDTNEPATSRVDYGETINYGSTLTSSTLVTSHQIQLTSLTPDTLYHFRVASTDAVNNTALSSDRTFRTLDTIPPVISNIQVINITNNSATITWVTNEATTSRIFYRRQGTIPYLVFTDDNLLVSHFNTLTGLIANVAYEFYIIAQDASGNTAQSSTQLFRTLPDNVPPANIQNFTATPDDTLNVLTWQNPTNPDYLGVYIVASTSTYPMNVREGRVVYVGPGVSFTDTELTNGTKYYYTGFAYDTSLNYASGAITDGTPFGLEEEIPEEEEEIPEIEIPSINLG